MSDFRSKNLIIGLGPAGAGIVAPGIAMATILGDPNP